MALARLSLRIKPRRLRQLIPESIVTIGLLNSGAWAAQPSFDCSKASRPDEYAICSNETLAKIDIIANEGYRYLISSLGARTANTIDMRFIKMRQACGGNYACILESQIEAIEYFRRHGAPVSVPVNLVQSTRATANPSFDCSKASRPDENAICSNMTLALMDKIANDGYIYLKSILGANRANAIDIKLIRARQACLENYSCILNSQVDAIHTFAHFGAPVSVPDHLDRSPPGGDPQVGPPSDVEHVAMKEEGGVLCDSGLIQ